MKKQLLVFVSTLFLSSISSAAIIDKCPEVSDIQTVGLNHFEVVDANHWRASYLPSNKFGTDADWSINIGNQEASDMETDLNKIAQKATAALPKLILAHQMLLNNIGLCVYTTTGKEDSGIMAVLLSPPESQMK